jgi:hypothetical protein
MQQVGRANNKKGKNYTFRSMVPRTPYRGPKPFKRKERLSNIAISFSK